MIFPKIIVAWTYSGQGDLMIFFCQNQKLQFMLLARTANVAQKDRKTLGQSRHHQFAPPEIEMIWSKESRYGHILVISLMLNVASHDLKLLTKNKQKH